MKITPNAPTRIAPSQPTAANVKMIQWYDDHWYKVDYVLEDVPQTRFIPSVTTKLGITAKPYIAKWRGDVGNREADLRMIEAQERGKRLHAAWYTFCMGGLVIYNPWNKPVFSKEEISAKTEEFLGNIFVIQYQEEMLHMVKLYKWVDTIKPEFLFCEKTVYSLTHNDAGTADTIVRIPGGLYKVNGAKEIAIPAGNYILDLKTGAQVDDDAYLQTAAYLKCAEEMGLSKFDGTIILHTQAKIRTGIEGLATIVHMRPEVEDHYNEYRLVSTLWERRHQDDSPKVFEFPATLNIKDVIAN